MPEPEKPELKCDNRWHWDLTWTFPYCPACESRERSPEALEAVAHRWQQPGGAYIYFDGPDPKGLQDRSLDLCSLPAAQALLQERDERIAELRDRLVGCGDPDCMRCYDDIAMESKLARWRKVARVAVKAQRWLDQKSRSPYYSVDLDRSTAWERIEEALSDLSEPERAELLEEGKSSE